MAVNILVADDSVTMRRIMEITFAGEDAKVVTVDSGEAAVAKAQELRPDVVFADASMPGADGYAVASAIKSTPGLEQTVVVVLASQKHPYDESKGKAAGVDDHVLKPFDTQHVIDKVHQILSQPRPVARPAAPQMAPPAQRPPARVGAPPSPIQGPNFARPAPTSPGIASPPAAARRPAPAAPPAPARPAAPEPVRAAAAGGAADLASKLDGLGLNADQVAGVLAISREVIERVVWEVVPDLAETIIKEEIRRLTQ